MTAPAAGDWRERYGTGLFCVLFAGIAALGFVGPLGSAALSAIAGALALPLLRPDRRSITGAGLLLALALFAAASMAWSRITPQIGGVRSYGDLEELTAVKLVIQALLYGSLMMAAARLTAPAAERSLRVFALALTALAALLIVEGLSTAALYRAMEAMIGQPIRPDLAMRNVAQGGYVVALMVWPAAMLLRREGRSALVVTLMLGVIGATVLFGADAPAVALIAGFIAWTLVLLLGRPAVLGLGAAAAAYLLSAPWLAHAADDNGLFAQLKTRLPSSWDARLDIWAFASARVSERPWLGWGLDASRTWPGSIPLHTHDGAVQIWLELGLAGALLATALAGFVFTSIAQAREGRGFMAVASATAVGYLTIGALSFGVWQEWWLALGAVAVCACLALKRAIPLWDQDGDIGGRPFDQGPDAPTLP